MNNKSHIIQLLHSALSGKKKIVLDGKVLFYDKNDNKYLSYEFNLESHKFQILETDKDEDRYSLKIDGIHFILLKEMAKKQNKELSNNFLSNEQIIQTKKNLDSDRNIHQNNLNKLLDSFFNFDNNFNNMNYDLNKNNNFITNKNVNMNNNNISNNNMSINNNMINNNNFTNLNDNNNKIKELEIKNRELEDEIKLFREYCHFSSNERLINFNFSSADQIINYSIVGKNTDDFTKYEKMLYEKYPKYKDTENFFLVNGKKINRNRTLEENNIKNNDIVILNIIDD